MSFDHRDPGTPEAVWTEAPRLRAARPLDLDGLDRLVVLAAHPDDESLGAGGLIALAARAGAQVRVVVATLGERSHPGSPTRSAADLARVRRAEAAAATDRLAEGVVPELLELPDGALDTAGEALRAPVAEAAAWAAAGHRGVLAAPWGGDGHVDHEVLGRTARAAASAHGVECLEYPVWLWHWGVPSDLPPHGIRVLPLDGAARAAKERALAAHASQVLPLSPAPGDEALLGPHVLARFRRPAEHFFVLPPAGTAPDPAAVFDDVHRGAEDPWDVDSSWYERRKRAVTLAALPRPRYRRVLEAGCSVGALTAELAERAGTVLAVDASGVAVGRARERLAGRPGVRVERRRLPGQWPPGRFDLVVVSETGYFLDAAQLSGLLDRTAEALAPDGHLLLCHWRHPIEGWPLDGADVHAAVRADARFARVLVHTERDFVLEVYEAAASRGAGTGRG
ncbi:PIG-L family deacetylase [Kocuria sp. CPCC 205268]|uniref:PIG-L family deacetylase n=1 Tax=Kocuria oxytropis TaxID=3058913 RepID=UPI0034D68516